MSLKDEIKSLRQELTEANHRYYILDDPTLSDAEYDRKLKRLGELEAELGQPAPPDSPTQRVGARPAQGFSEVTHTIPMLRIFEGKVKMVKVGDKMVPTGGVYPISDWINSDEIQW